MSSSSEASNYSCSENDGDVKFTLSSSPHSAWRPTSNCSLQQCHLSLNNNNSCLLSSTPCFDYRTRSNSSYCAPGIFCSILEPCNNITYTCASTTSVCIVNSCCSPQAVCLPLLWISFCILGWFNTGSMNSIRYRNTATVLSNSKVLVTGGGNVIIYVNSAELYDPSTGAWIIISSMNSARSEHTASVLTNGKVLVTGGHTGNNHLSSAELYDPSTGARVPTGNMNHGRSGHTASVLTDGKVLVTGGTNGSFYLDTAELY